MSGRSLDLAGGGANDALGLDRVGTENGASVPLKIDDWEQSSAPPRSPISFPNEQYDESSDHEQKRDRSHRPSYALVVRLPLDEWKVRESAGD